MRRALGARRRAIVTLGVWVLALGVPAVGFAEQVRPTPGGGAASCLRGTGAGGGLALLGGRTDRGYATELFVASPVLVEPVGSVVLGHHLDRCAATAQANGAAVVAGTLRSQRRVSVVAAVRDAGGGFGAPAVLGEDATQTLATAMSARGDAAVAWMESRAIPGAARGSEARLLIAVRPAGGRFGPAREVFGWSRSDPLPTTALAMAFDAAGALTVAWTRPRPAHGGIGDLADVEVASARPGARLGPTQLLARDRQEVHRIALSVAPEGGAVVAFVSTGRVELFGRPPGSTAFAPQGTVSDAAPNTDHLPSDVAVALDDGGGAVVAWREDVSARGAKLPRDVVLVRTRAADGPFGAPRVVADDPAEDGGRISVVFVGGDGPPFDDPDQPSLQLALGDDGRVALAWMRGDPGGPHEARGATIAPDGAISVRALGSPCRRPSGVATLLAAAVPMVAYANNLDTLAGEVPLRGGSLHVVRADELSAPPPVASPPPTARVRLTAPRRLRFGQKLAIPVLCDRDCDILVQAGASGLDLPWAIESGASARAGVTRQVVLDPRSATLVSSRAHGVPLRVTACAPDGSSSTTTKLVQPAAQIPPRPGPIPRAVRARRSGQSIVVTWSIARPLPSISFLVIGTRKPADGLEQPYVRTVRGRQRRRFRVVLRPEDPRAIVAVTVAGRTNEPPYRGGARTVPVR